MHGLRWINNKNVVAKIIADLTTFVINIAAGVAVLLMMGIAMNGFNERDATGGAVAYIILGLIISVTMSLGAFFLSGRLIKKHFSSAASVLIGIAVFVFAGIVLKIISGLIGVGIAEYLRVTS